MAQVTMQDIMDIKAGKTFPFVMSQPDAIRLQARLSWYKRSGNLPFGISGYESHYNKEQGVLLVTACRKEDCE